MQAYMCDVIKCMHKNGTNVSKMFQEVHPDLLPQLT